jgi:alkylation response protein AidB-like acyl-CoA dehydrogenase
VGLSSDELLIPPRAGLGLVRAASTLDHVVQAIAAVGIGRAAYEGALRLAREREYKGTLLAEHGHARRRLFRLFTLLEAARALTRAAHLQTRGESGRGDGPLQHATAAHAFAIEAALDIVDGAMELCTGRADARGVVEYLDGSTFQLEKLLRDAQSCKVARPASGLPAPLAAAYP